MIDGFIHAMGDVLILLLGIGAAALINGAWQFAVKWYEEIERGGWDE